MLQNPSNNNQRIQTMFLEQSFLDSQADHLRSLKNPDAPHFDAVIITASNEHQAEIFRTRLELSDLPEGTDFIVLPDKNGERIGSGGATLEAVRYIGKKYGGFNNRRVAVIHSGGDGKRIPNYSAMGKLFSPVPRLLPGGRPSTLFDEIMISIAGIPSRIKEGMLILSGDILLLFNPLQIDFCGHGAAALAFKESVKTGVNHGVYLQGKEDNVAYFLHKQSEEYLRSTGAVNENGNVSIDTGAVLFAPDILESMYKLVDTPEKAEKYINTETRLSFYADFLYPLAEESTLEEYYLEKPEGEFNSSLRQARTVLWQTLRQYRLQQINLSPSKFIHFGTTAQVMELMNDYSSRYSSLGWSRVVNSFVPDGAAAYNSLCDPLSEVGSGTYLECSHILGKSKIGRNCLISSTELKDKTVPDNTVLHCLKLLDGRFVCRIYGVDDNPKEDKIFGIPFSEIEFINADSLWDAEIYPVCENVSLAVDCALELYDMITGGKSASESYRKTEKKSLWSGFNEADPVAINQWLSRMDELIRMHKIESLIDSGLPASDAGKIITSGCLTVTQRKWLDSRVSSLDMSKPEGLAKAIRLYRYTDFSGENDREKQWFRLISQAIQSVTMRKFGQVGKSGSKVTVRLPLRVNFGGVWSDTPPYCLENGGKVLNCAIKINGECPVNVTVERIEEKKMVFNSGDMNVYGEFTDISDLQDFGNPYDSFALQKACLLVCGIIPREGGNLAGILEKLGFGIRIDSFVTGVPKGSGLGTSSILAAACSKAILDFFGISYTLDDLYGYVLAEEQIMSTGGGWQDQTGGMTPGMKLVSSEPGICQKISVENISLSEKTKKELSERFCLIYTGQRRLARNLLRDVVGRYISNEPECVGAYKEIKGVAGKMKYALESDDVDEFAHLLSYHLGLSKKINPETVNTLIEDIFATVGDMTDGRFVCGAGGGGFLQVILKKGFSKEELHRRLKAEFGDFPIDVYDCELLL